MITRDRARGVLENVANALCQSIVEKSVYLSPDIMADSSIVQDDGVKISSPYKMYFFGFVDEAPRANWSHNCQYVFINAHDGYHHVVHGNWPPDILENLEKIL
ncbi:hypothetical protein HY485_03910 [Candidatus Woesearchaeota archaeon]|nr:hypothetical protein [Candidatus Woesearchaeota archaeon]